MTTLNVMLSIVGLMLAAIGIAVQIRHASVPDGTPQKREEFEPARRELEQPKAHRRGLESPPMEHPAGTVAASKARAERMLEQLNKPKSVLEEIQSVNYIMPTAWAKDKPMTATEFGMRHHDHLASVRAHGDAQFKEEQAKTAMASFNDFWLSIHESRKRGDWLLPPVDDE